MTRTPPYDTQGSLPGFEPPPPPPVRSVRREPSPFHTPTIEQVAIVDYVRSGTGHLLVQALAGTGKTSTILECLAATRAQKVLLCAFNIKIAKTLKARIARLQRPVPGGVIVAGTLHSHGLSIVQARSETEFGFRPEVRKYVATEKYVKELVEAIVEITAAEREQLRRDDLPDNLLNRWFQVAIDPNSSKMMIPYPIKRAAIQLLRRLKETYFERDVDEDKIENIGHKIGAFIHINDSDVPLACALTRLGYLNGARLGHTLIDYCDMIWLPKVLELAPPQYDLVFVDEAQDLSWPMFEFARQFLADGGRLVVVGDLCQSVYGWRDAAGPRIWSTMREEMQAAVLPLTVTFRCASAVVEEVNDLVPALRAKEGAPRGVVRRCAFTTMLSELSELPKSPGSIFVLSRNNADLFKTALGLWRARANFRFNKARELATDLGAIIDRLDKINPERFRRSLDKWYQVAREQAEDHSAVALVDRLDDLYQTILALLSYAEPRHLQALLDKLVESKGTKIELSTVHGAKGLEADRVYLLRQTFARYQNDDGPIPQEELNLEYVAVTRARSEVVWVDLPGHVVDVQVRQ